MSFKNSISEYCFKYSSVEKNTTKNTVRKKLIAGNRMSGAGLGKKTEHRVSPLKGGGGGNLIPREDQTMSHSIF